MNVVLALGRRWGTARGHYWTPARSSLTCGACKGSGEKRGPAPEGERRDGAPRGARVSETRRGTKNNGRALRRSIPSAARVGLPIRAVEMPEGERKDDDAPGVAKNTGAGARHESARLKMTGKACRAHSPGTPKNGTL